MEQELVPTLLEIEAADFFKLDSSQVHMFARANSKESGKVRKDRHVSNKSSRLTNDMVHQQKLGARDQHQIEIESHRSTNINSKMKQRQWLELDATRRRTSNHSNIRIPTHSPSPALITPTHLLESSTISTNSLPSITSSPSVSPSLLCPHLSLDDVLELRNDSKSPHTIGLCRECRLNPPPKVHSPLSPLFKPSLTQTNSAPDLTLRHELKRGYSDQQVGARSVNRSHESSRKRTPRETANLRDDSLDYYLEPGELRRLRLSPSLRHSVEFIRKNSIESGRVFKIYQNGRPFDKPIRVCATRGEFANLNQLLDHINSRQLIPSGARYLFHIDGQLVYSVNELKHGSAYIVSGSRTFEFRTNSILKEKQRKELRELERQQGGRVASKIDGESANQLEYISARGELPGEGSRSEARKDEHPQRATQRLKQTKPNKCEISDQDPPEDIARTTISENQVLDPLVEQGDSSVSKSNEDVRTEELIGEASVKVVRAKSELSALPSKRKKNVTFVDTGRGSSPAIYASDIDKQNTIERRELGSSDTTLKTNEIGIQVSDSIEGFLIDLPIPVPANEPKKEGRSRFLKKGQGARARMIGKNSGVKASTGVRTEIRKPKIIAIRERQLSRSEMDELKDLDHGDHHSDLSLGQESLVTIKLEETVASLEKRTSSKENDERILSDETKAKSAAQGASSTSELGLRNDDDLARWQYPGGREASATPTERPVSQNDANEIIHARVSTPTPSLSTQGDNTSMIVSCESSIGLEIGNSPSRVAKSDLPMRRNVPVKGKLCDGSNLPAKNFRLTWVNGFTINDQYPENSTTLNVSGTDLSESKDQSMLSPSSAQRDRPNLFRPSERFSNWVCHSKRHDELIYPAGSLVVLWSRCNHEQRYYSKHTSNISTITLASLDPDLAASAQVTDPDEKIDTSVHLWSLTTLETLLVIEDEKLCGRLIYSLQVRNTITDGCEILVAAKDEKRLWMLDICAKLSSTGQVETAEIVATNPPKQTKQPLTDRTVMKANKLLQSNQTPLLIIRMSNVQSSAVPSEDKLDDAILSFGRRHFQIWLSDRKRQKLTQTQPADKYPSLSDMIAHANCLVRMSPKEYLIGGQKGDLLYLSVDRISTSASKVLIGSDSNRKYSISTSFLLGGEQDERESSTFPGTLTSITCLTRITGSVFISGDSACSIRFWRIERPIATKHDGTARKSSDQELDKRATCRQLIHINLPQDLGFICAIKLAKYNRKQSMVDFYVISTSNAILFGSVRLDSGADLSGGKLIVPSSALSVVYEGHETSVMNLISDCSPPKAQRSKDLRDVALKTSLDYFTCSLDCKICKWSGPNLVWKSILPSACASLAIHPMGFVLAVGSADGTVYILDKVSGLLISYFPLTPVCINCLTYTRDGTLLAAGCANGSIFILPVYETGLKYKKVSIFQSPYPVVSIQFSVDNQYILTSVTHGSYQELILWDLPNFRYMRDNVKLAADRIEWFDSICSGSEDVRAIWENSNLAIDRERKQRSKGTKRNALGIANQPASTRGTIVNLSCHRLIRSQQKPTEQPNKVDFAIASDTRGYLRLFQYPCYDIQQGFYEVRVSSSAVNCCRFLTQFDESSNKAIMFASTSIDGSICLWTLD